MIKKYQHGVFSLIVLVTISLMASSSFAKKEKGGTEDEESTLEDIQDIAEAGKEIAEFLNNPIVKAIIGIVPGGKIFNIIILIVLMNMLVVIMMINRDTTKIKEIMLSRYFKYPKGIMKRFEIILGYKRKPQRFKEFKEAYPKADSAIYPLVIQDGQLEVDGEKMIQGRAISFFSVAKSITWTPAVIGLIITFFIWMMTDLTFFSEHGFMAIAMMTICIPYGMSVLFAKFLPTMETKITLDNGVSIAVHSPFDEKRMEEFRKNLISISRSK